MDAGAFNYANELVEFIRREPDWFEIEVAPQETWPAFQQAPSRVSAKSYVPFYAHPPR